MNSGLLGALGSQPLKTQRFYNRPYGSSLVLSNHIPNFNITTYRTPNLTNWSSNGTMLGINASPTFNGDFINAQINSSDRFKVDSLGSIYMGKTTPSLARRGDIDLLYLNSVETGTSVAAGGAGLRFGSGSTLLWTHDIPAQTPNTGFSWEGFGALGMKSGTQTQSLRIYNTFTSTTNYERFTIDWQTNPNTCVIATSAAGAGLVRGMEFRVGTTTAMNIASSGNITFGVNGALNTPAVTITGNILSGGSSTTTRPLIDYRSTGSTPNFSTNGTLFGGNLPSGYLGDLFNYRYYNGAALFRVDMNGSLYGNFNAEFGGGVTCNTFLAGNSMFIGTSLPGLAGNGGMSFRDSDIIGWSGTSTWFNAIDLVVRRDGSNSLAQRNGTNAQSHRLYNTFTSTTNYERFTIDWQTKPNTCVIATSAAGTGVVRDMEFRVGSTTAMSFTTAGNTIINGNLTINGNQPGYSPARPSFRVYGSGTTNNLSTTQNSTGVLNNNNFAVDHNQGLYLDVSTGVFTAPVAGIYQINLVARNSDYSSGISQIACIKNVSTTNQVMTFIEWATSSSMNHAGASTCAYLAASDTLCIKILAGEVDFDGNDSWSVTYLG